MRSLFIVFSMLLILLAAPAMEPSSLAPRDALRPFNDLIGTWRGTGSPTGSREQQEAGFWQETITCAWKFQGTDARIVFDFEKSKHYRHGELDYLPARKQYHLRIETVDGKSQDLTGTLEGRNLTLQSD